MSRPPPTVHIDVDSKTPPGGLTAPTPSPHGPTWEETTSVFTAPPPDSVARPEGRERGKAPLPPPDDAFAPGTRLARRYVIHERIGGGGMAQVYRAEHETIARPVAIKVLARSLCRKLSVVVRFLQEARTSSTIRHENIVEVTDFGETEEDQPFLVMEYLEGEDLGATLAREGPFRWDRARSILVQILAALQAAHDHGVVHRDVKPENVFRTHRMGSSDFIKVFDFGIAKVLMDDEGKPSKPLTLDGQIMGTPAYMSPEQCLGQEVDARSDLYSVGVIAYQMLTGRRPFECDTPNAVIYSQIYEDLPPMWAIAPHLDIDESVERRIARALEKRPVDRYASARDFAEALLEDTDPTSSGGLLPGLRSLFRRKK